MEEVRAKLIQRIKRTSSVESFRFLPEKKIDFIAGQFLQVIFDENNRNNKELNKYLSFSSSPGHDYFEVTKRISESAFSAKLESLKTGDDFLFKASMGACVFKDEYKKIAFLIGGIGITPVISIIEYITGNKINTDVMLFYSNRNEEDIAFKTELDKWRENNLNIKVFYTVTDCQPVNKECIFGRIDKDLLLNKIPDIKERLFFIFGPPKMVEAMENICVEVSSIKENIKTESFIGY
ncbi:MAG: FAD-dependent oxidoreductase [Candidatus Omnitrophota bacterium]|nr:FAD-dependent oxidoreductase [Candidatus Omnitrophota bacterium]MBU1929692.1 FAD-dependent oxidoreductase [Candidatus Omnitrophota bacterium]MBU2035090.1 FAD-dependent oxidoreductase [Candidatus Omnitrophota bacterium]MBU2221229.1 FAD-dependent oxidoreductase [Candidatus Omnitrophota bacterium]